ncbi:MAG: RMD1 family protein, partial [Proteobacteria bacterium]
MFEGKNRLQARALLVGERFDLKALENSAALGEGPLVITAGTEGAAVLFRFGAVVLFGVSPLEEAAFLTQLKALVRDPFEVPEFEGIVLELSSD